MAATATVRHHYDALIEAWGPQDWWPARSRLEVIAGAILTQNTAWSNVERALRNLRRVGVLSVDGVRAMPRRKLEQLIRPAGYFRQKARRLKNFVRYLDAHYRGSLTRMFARPTEELRAELLALNGVGPETADSILLYAGGHPVFVVDAYTRRIFARHSILPASASYDEIRTMVEDALRSAPPPVLSSNEIRETRNPPRRHKYVVRRAPSAAQVYNEFHALLVLAAKRHCLKAEAKCEGCPLQPLLPG
ncbi:MAG TPA: base excision DNA repair protein [Terriglobales bacterium]|nr:base excision DNA repair protein [Terriglobales bacterium]